MPRRCSARQSPLEAEDLVSPVERLASVVGPRRRGQIRLVVRLLVSLSEIKLVDATTAREGGAQIDMLGRWSLA
jgi:hypothetical protein